MGAGSTEALDRGPILTPDRALCHNDSSGRDLKVACISTAISLSCTNDLVPEHAAQNVRAEYHPLPSRQERGTAHPEWPHGFLAPVGLD